MTCNSWFRYLWTLVGNRWDGTRFYHQLIGGRNVIVTTLSLAFQEGRWYRDKFPKKEKRKEHRGLAQYLEVDLERRRCGSGGLLNRTVSVYSNCSALCTTRSEAPVIMRDEFVYSYPDVEEGFKCEKTWLLIDKLWPATSKCRNRNGIRDSVEKLLHAASSDRLNFSPHSFRHLHPQFFSLE